MSKKYLLYIDILGFSDLVKNDPQKVEHIYNIIDNLNAHQHNAFKTIVFSDTILVYNIIDPVSIQDHQYLVMYLCEFVQDLLYRTITKNVYFKAILVYENFKHYHLKNVECFFGKGLIDSYNKEKEIVSIGLYIHEECNKYNNIFPTLKYDSDYRFVYLNQDLERLLILNEGKLPIDESIIEETDDFCRLIWDVELLKNVHHLMINHPLAKVRIKYLSYWQFYKMRYKNFIDALENYNFNAKVICESVNWDKRISSMLSEDSESN